LMRRESGKDDRYRVAQPMITGHGPPPHTS
jgi:hypothetical protein